MCDGRISRGLVFILLGLTYAAPAARAQGSDVIRLPWKQWAVHLTDDPRCAAIADPACVWQPATGPSNSAVDLWQRTEITLPAELRSAQQLALLIQGERPVYEVYVNGHLIGASGSFLARRGPLNARAIFPVSSTLALDGRLVIAIRAMNVPAAGQVERLAPALGPINRIDSARDLDTYGFLRAESQRYLSSLIIFCAGLVFLLFFAMETRSTEYLWLGLNLTTFPIFRLLEFATIVNLGIPFDAAYAAFVGCNAIFGVISIEFSFAFLRKKVWPVFRLVEAIGLLYALELLLLLPHPAALFAPVAAVNGQLFEVQRAGLLLSALARFVPLPMCFRSRLAEMRWIGVALTFMGFESLTRQLSFLGMPSVPQDFPLGPLDFDLLGSAYLVFAVVMLVAMTIRFRRIQDRNRTIEQELAAAAAVQQLLISSASSSTPAFAVETVYLPAGEVGGDFFQIIPDRRPERDGSLLVLVGDVSGKGLQAALTVSTIIGAVRDFGDRRPRFVLEHVNRVLLGHIAGFATCCVAHMTPDGAMTLSNAGHPNPYLDGAEYPTEPNLPLGVTGEVVYAETRVDLAAGQIFTLVTDGVIEAAHATTRELFGFDRTQAISDRSADAIAEAARAFGAGGPQVDDITVLTVRYMPTRAAGALTQEAGQV